MPVWGGESIEYLVEKEAVQGYADGTFRPNNKLTRAHAAKILAVSLNLPVQESATSTFRDTTNHWADPYIAAIQTELKNVIKGYPDGNFRPNRPITRAQLTKMMVEAYDLTRDPTTHIYFSDMPDAYAQYIQTLGSLGIVQGPVKGEFRPYENVTRLQMAAMIHRTEVEEIRLPVAEKEMLPSIETVTVFNETKFEVTFAEAIRPEIAHEMEYSGKRFVVYVKGQSLHSDSAVQSQTIRFNKTYTKASVILAEDTIRTDATYTVALLDSDHPTVADVIDQFTPIILKKGTAQPTVIIDEKQNKVIVQFHEKMAQSALDARNYHIYESSQSRGSLAEYSDTDEDGRGSWRDATEKTAVEFPLSDEAQKKQFLIGRSYKMVVSEAVETEKGAVLSEQERIIPIEIPARENVEPKAQFARMEGNTLIILFDQQLVEGILNPPLITIQQANGHTIPVSKIDLASTDDSLGHQEMRITVAEGYKLERKLTYTIDLPENIVAHAVFPNVTNNPVTGLVAHAQQDIEVKIVTAHLMRQKADKSKANLHLTFDQRIDVAYLKVHHHDAILLRDGEFTYQLVDANSIMYDDHDTSGKTIVIQDVEKAFTLQGDMAGKHFQLQSGKVYRTELMRNRIKTENGVQVNQDTLSSQFKGIGVSAPKFEQIVLASAEEIIVYFKEEINGTTLQPHHIRIKGFERYPNGNFTEMPILLTGKSQLKTRVDGKKLIITPASEEVRFVTSKRTDLLEIQGDVLKGTESGVANTKLSTADGFDTLLIIDRATPMLVGAEKEDDRTLVMTYSEPIIFTGEEISKQAEQFSVENATKNAYGEKVMLQSPNANGYADKIHITFNKTGTFPPDLDLEEVQVVYGPHPYYYVRDVQGNSQKEGRAGVTKFAK